MEELQTAERMQASTELRMVERCSLTGSEFLDHAGYSPLRANAPLPQRKPKVEELALSLMCGGRGERKAGGLLVTLSCDQASGYINDWNVVFYRLSGRAGFASRPGAGISANISVHRSHC